MIVGSLLIGVLAGLLAVAITLVSGGSVAAAIAAYAVTGLVTMMAVLTIRPGLAWFAARRRRRTRRHLGCPGSATRTVTPTQPDTPT